MTGDLWEDNIEITRDSITRSIHAKEDILSTPCSLSSFTYEILIIIHVLLFQKRMYRRHSHLHHGMDKPPSSPALTSPSSLSTGPIDPPLVSPHCKNTVGRTFYRKDTRVHWFFTENFCIYRTVMDDNMLWNFSYIKRFSHELSSLNWDTLTTYHISNLTYFTESIGI